MNLNKLQFYCWFSDNANLFWNKVDFIQSHWINDKLKINPVNSNLDWWRFNFISKLRQNNFSYFKERQCHSPNVSTTPITAMGCQQCLPPSVVQLKGKHCRKPHCRNGVVDTFRLWLSSNKSLYYLPIYLHLIFAIFQFEISSLMNWIFFQVWNGFFCLL